MKKTLPALCALLVLSLLITGCDRTPPERDPGQIAEDLVRVETFPNDCGDMLLPVFNGERLDPEDAEKANELMASIRSGIEENIAEFRDTISFTPSADGSSDAVTPLALTRYAVGRNLLSVQVEYSYFFHTPHKFYEALNFDLTTGEIVAPEDALARYGFSIQDAVQAAEDYARKFTEHELSWDLVCRAADEQTFWERLEPDRTPGDPYGEPFDRMRSELEHDSRLDGSVIDLPRYPSVFCFGDDVSVVAGIPTMADSGNYDFPVWISDQYDQLLLKNPDTPFGQPFGNGPATAEVAVSAVEDFYGLDADGVSPDTGSVIGIEPERTAFISGSAEDGPSVPAVLMTVRDTKSGETSRFALAVFAGGGLFRLDGDVWTPISDGTGPLPEAFVTEAVSRGCIASVYNESTPYERWRTGFSERVDLSAYDGPDGYPESGAVPILLFTPLADTTVTYWAVAPGADGTDPEPVSPFRSSCFPDAAFHLIYALRSEGIPERAIEISSGGSDVWYYLTEDGRDGVQAVEYLGENAVG